MVLEDLGILFDANYSYLTGADFIGLFSAIEVPLGLALSIR